MRTLVLTTTAALFLSAACADPPQPARVAEAGTFASMVESLSEEGGYFDTDNLISNETSYLHVLTELAERGLEGGAYLGVGPGQNFSYIAALRPRLAIVVDIRRDNVLQHLLYKALFAASENRVEYLANLVGAEAPPRGDPIYALDDIERIVEAVDGLPPARGQTLDSLTGNVRSLLESTGIELSEGDHRTIARFHDEFRREGLSLQFRSHGRSPQPYYPTLRRLLLERDLDGAQGSYLSSAEAFGFIRRMQAEDRIVPVVGDLSGPSALRRIGDHLRNDELAVSAFYTSNVEFYLFQARTFERFVDNVRALPLAEDGVFIRSYFNRFRTTHPETVPGYASTQLVQTFDEFLEAASEGVSYRELMFR